MVTTTRGWYLYGITRRAPAAALLSDADAGENAGASPLELLECSGLAAVVRPVSLAEFAPDAMRERLQDVSAMETMVRSHNRIIEIIHARQAILPATFGVVYNDSRDILSALRSACETLLPQLHRLEGCDEWAVHVYADRAAVRDRVAERNPALGRMRDEIAAASPGRAYFMERKFREAMETATRQAMVTLAKGAYDRLIAVAEAGQANRIESAGQSAGDEEILRAALLVSRERTGVFEAEVASVTNANDGLRCECTGPWPPYSFTTAERGVAA